MILIFYNLALLAALVVSAPWWLWKMATTHKYRAGIGDRLRAGEAIIEITQPRGPCSALDVYGGSLKDEIYDAQVKALDPSSPRWGMSGLYASVAQPGVVRSNDPIAVILR